MADTDQTIEILKERVKKFCEEREWDQFHSAKDLAIGLSTESAELLEIFRFQSVNQELFLLESKREEISDELSDCLFFLLRFAQKYNFDLDECFKRKMVKNAKRYTLERSKGSNDKL